MANFCHFLIFDKLNLLIYQVICFLAFIIFVIFLPVRSFAIFEDAFISAKSLAMSDSMVAYENESFYRLNPSLAGGIRDFSFMSSYGYGHVIQQGEKRVNNLKTDFFFPARVKAKNCTFMAGYDINYEKLFNEKIVYLGLASWHLFEENGKVLDLGASLKSLKLSGENILEESKFAIDLGAIVIVDKYSFGFSILNANSPKFENIKDNAPMIMKAGISRKEEDFSLNLDLTRRNSINYGKSYNINSGFEYYWRTYKSGVFNTLFGLSLGDNKSMFTGGFGYKNMAAEIIYAFGIPFSKPFVITNGISLILRFGDRNIENEYEKVVKREMQYRRDLMESLEQSEKRERQLKSELLLMKEELEKLSEELRQEKIKKSELEQAKNRLNEILERQRRTQEELRLMEEKRKQDRIKRFEDSFSIDWENYIRLKNSGANKEALIGVLRKIIAEYQQTGIDISLATLELQKLLK